MRFVPLALAALAAALPVAAAAQEVAPAVSARNAHMTLYSFNLGALGAMAKGEVAYDAEVAQGHADALASLAAQSEEGYWVEGTAQGEAQGSRALPAIWAQPEEFTAARAGLAEASATLAGAAGGSLEEMQAAFGPTGAACGTCHKAFRGER